MVCPEAFSGPAPMAIPLSWKVAVPVAMLKPPKTVAPKLTVSPNTEGFLVELSAVVVGHAFWCATTAVNGVFVRPVVVMFLISTPGLPPLRSVPTRKRMSTL